MELNEIIEEMKGEKVLVLGDVTLDKYIDGQVTKISPEAPVPQVDVKSEKYMLGGAANVINNLHALEANVGVATVVGKDFEGDYLIKEIEKRNIDPTGIFAEDDRITALVARVRVEEQQLLRLDRSKDEEIKSNTVDKITRHLKEVADNFDIFVVSDYGRGSVPPALIDKVVEIGKKNNKKIIVNPKRENFSNYECVDVIRTNRQEASYFTGITSINETSIRNMGQKILTSLQCGAVLITWIEEGFHLFQREGEVSFIPPIIERPVDPTGVGDTITCAFALARAAGASLEESSQIANYAGAIAASTSGLATVSLEELREAVSKDSI